MKNLFTAVFAERIKIVLVSALLIFAFSLDSLASGTQSNATSIWRCKDKCTIHVKFQFSLSGTTSDADFNSWKSKLEDCFKGLNCKIPCKNSKKSCKITIEVDVQKTSGLSSGDKSKYHEITLRAADNKPSTAHMGEVNGKAGSASIRRNAIASEICHELGHLGGLKDKYCGKNTFDSASWTEPNCKPGQPDPCNCTIPPGKKRCTTPCNGHANDIMGAIPNKFSCDNILAMVTAAGLNSCPVNPCCPQDVKVPKATEPPNTQEKVKVKDTKVKWKGSPCTAGFVQGYVLTMTKTDHTPVLDIYVPHVDGQEDYEYPIPCGVLEYGTTYLWRVCAEYDPYYYAESLYCMEEEWSFTTSENVFYVNNHPGIGADEWDGLHELPSLPDHGPKATIQAAIDAYSDCEEDLRSGRVIHIAGPDMPEHLQEPFQPPIPGHYQSIEVDVPMTLIGESLFEEEPLPDLISTPVIHSMSPAVTSLSPSTVKLINLTIAAWSPNPLFLINGPGHVVCTDCYFFKDAIPLLTCPQVLLHTQDGRIGLGPGWLFFNQPPCAPYYQSLALWLDPTGISSLNNQPVSFWPDNTLSNLPYTPAYEHAIMADVHKQPKYLYSGINLFPSVDYEKKYGNTEYGLSDVMESPYSKFITSDNNDHWQPVPQSKSLYLVFQTGNSVNNDGEHPYYSDGRQTLFEAGGPLSGMNIYISNGKLVFGMWNRFQQQFLMYDPADPNSFYPLDPNTVYLAHLEYNGDPGHLRFRASVAKDNQTISSPDLPEFAGLTRDNNDQTGVGAACRTRYYDYSTGETYSDHFGGILGDVMLYNAQFDPAQQQQIYEYIGGRYNQLWAYDNTAPAPKKGDWKIFENSIIEDNPALSEAYPNPFIHSTSIGIFLPQSAYLKVMLYNSMGKLVMPLHKGMMQKGINEIFVDGSNLPSGVYFARFSGDNFEESIMIILNK